jgi:Xaa-Pro aminopeptidase
MDSHGRNYSRYFIHSTGHGIGLDVHEKPWVRSKSQEILLKGMAITIEPGVYLHGKFGIRIEDSLVVANDDPIEIGDKKIKVTNLNHFTKEMLEID